MRRIFVYLKMSVKTIVRYPSWKTVSNVFRYARPWYSLSTGKISSIEKKIPWLCFSAIDHISKVIRPDMKIFEYGSGGSTLFWASRVRQVVSVEHDEQWQSQMEQEFAKQNAVNVTYVLASAEKDEFYQDKSPGDPRAYISGDPDYIGKKFETYVKHIDKYPNRYFDFVIVDGRARPSCVLHALPKVALNGFVVVDNTEREYYQEALDLMNNRKWKMWKFTGPVPYSPSFSETTIFQKIDL